MMKNPEGRGCNQLQTDMPAARENKAEVICKGIYQVIQVF